MRIIFFIKKSFASFWIVWFSMIDVQLYCQRNNSTFIQDSDSIRIEKVIAIGKSLIGKPYRCRISGDVILDCSGFVSHIYKSEGLNIPRSSKSLAIFSDKIDLTDVRKGDLLFFKGRNIKKRIVGHVALVINSEDGEIEMMHSCSRGVVIEKYNNNRYYTTRFLSAGRIPSSLSGNSIPKLKLNPADSESGNLVLTELEESPFSEKPDANYPNENQDYSSISKINIIGVGDIMLGTNFPNEGYLPPHDGKFILKPVKEIIKEADIAFGNLEGVFLTEDGNVKKCSNPNVCYAFKMPDHYAAYLKEAGFDLLSIANNHVRDFGSPGTSNTMKTLRETGIYHAGLLECPYTTFKKGTITYGFAAFAPNIGTVSINDYAQARRIISHLDSISDIVIVSFHGGAEGPTKNHITREKEIFLGENRGNPYEFSRIAIDAGADVIFGHGPHVSRAIDLYKGRFIAYSMGNFATFGRFNLKGPNGISPIISIIVDNQGRFISGKIIATRQLGQGGPVLDAQNKAIEEIKTLTESDIPECLLKIQKNGTIFMKP